MITEDNLFIEYVKNQVVEDIKYYANTISDDRATEIAKDTVRLIDWNDSAVLHKGLS